MGGGNRSYHAPLVKADPVFFSLMGDHELPGLLLLADQLKEPRDADIFDIPANAHMRRSLSV